MHLTFLHPLFFLLAPLALCFIWCAKEQFALYFAKSHLLPRSIVPKHLLPLFTALLFVIALAGPIAYEHLAQNAKKGRDLVVALDASGSMSGEFGKSTKFATLIELVRAFLHKRHDDNVGVVVFGSFAYAASPITYDIDALDFILRYLDVSIAGNNTAIGDAVATGVAMLQKAQANEKVLVLFSDGHHNSGSVSPKEAVERAKRAGVRIYTVGIGEDFDAKLMRRIAAETGGKSFQARNPEDLQEVLSAIDRLEPSPLRSGTYLGTRPLFVLLLVLLAVLLAWQIKRRL